MLNPYSSLIKYDEGDDFFDEHLKKMQLFDIFKELLSEFPDKKAFKGVVLFVLYGYSVESEMLMTTGLSWAKLSDNIFEKAGLEVKYYDQVAGLESDSVRSVIDKWLAYQNNEQFTQYITYRDLRAQFLAASLFPLPKTKQKQKVTDEGAVETEADFSKMKTLVEAKFLAATNSNELLKMMEDAKQKFIQTQPRLKTSVSALNKIIHEKATKSTEEIFASNGR